MKAVVTGGGGFVGRAIVERLLCRGHEVISTSRRTYPELEALGARCVAADLGSDAPDLSFFAGADVVFHVAALAGYWGKAQEFHRANVVATENVLAAARLHGVPRLVFTSSPSVCFDGHDHVRATDLPRAGSFLAHYPRTKARAEELALAANSPELATCALRPHLVFGPRDPHLLPRVVQRARAGKLPIVGDGSNEVSVTFVDNAAAAHVAAADRLEPGAAHAGRAYFLGQEQPVELWPWINRILAALDVPPLERRVSLGTASAAGRVCELLWSALPLPGQPPMTRFVARQLATSHSYDMAPARRDFGYVEEVGLEEATERAIADLRERVGRHAASV